MKKNDVTPEEMTAVCGRMVACRAADHLGITLARFYYLAQQYGLKTAFVFRRWEKEDKELMLQMINSGETQKKTAQTLGRSIESVRSMLTRMRRIQN